MSDIRVGDRVRYGTGQFDETNVFEIRGDRFMVCGGSWMDLSRVMRVTDYTVDQIDDALRAILGDDGVRVGDPGWHRTTQMIAAASVAWQKERPEDHHARILRDALRDLSEFGSLRPTNNVWPEDRLRQPKDGQ